MYDEINKDSTELRFKACFEELIDIAKQSESPSEVLKIVGDNFLSLAKGFECIERINEDRYQKTLIEIIDRMSKGEHNEFHN